MTKVISILVVLVLLYAGWHFYLYWVDVKNADAKQEEKTEVNASYLGGLPPQLYDSYNTAKQNGPKAMGAWLDAYGSQLDDPRKAWIQLDYVVSITRENPQEAKRIFADVKARTKEDSKVYPRVKQLEATYE